MLKLLSIAAVLAALGTATVPVAQAEPNPHIPNGKVGYCPGGDHREQVGGGGRYCLGVPFADGSFYAQAWRREPYKWFDPGFWGNDAECQFMVNGSVQGGRPYSNVLPSCGGGPDYLPNL